MNLICADFQPTYKDKIMSKEQNLENIINQTKLFMKKFKYKTVLRNYGNHITWLNEQGSSGWELIQIKFSKTNSDCAFFFKREIL